MQEPGMTADREDPTPIDPEPADRGHCAAAARAQFASKLNK